MTVNVYSGVSIEKLGWVAGILDLQGGTAQKTNRSRQSGRQGILYVESKNLQVIAKLARLTGSEPEPRTPRIKNEYIRRPCTEHCNDSHSHSDEYEFRPRTRWCISGAGAAVVLHSVMPYMRTDRGFREFQRYLITNTPFEGQAVGVIKKQLRRLTNLGWVLLPEFDRYRQMIEAYP